MPQRIKKIKFQHVTAAVLLILIAIKAWDYQVLKGSCLLRFTNYEEATGCGQDMDQYLDLSNSIMDGHGFKAHATASIYGLAYRDDNLYLTETNRLPGYPLVLSALRKISDSPNLLLYFNIICGIVILASAGFLVYRYIGFWQAALCVLWLLNYGQVLRFFWGGNSDIVAAAAISLLVTIFFTARDNWLTLFLCFFFGLWAVFLRQNSFLFVLPLMVTAAVVQRRKRAILPLLGIVICLGGWSLRNYIAAGRFTPSTLGGVQLFLEYPLMDLETARPATDEGQWFFFYSGREHIIAKAMKAGMDRNHAVGFSDASIMRLSLSWIFGHPIRSIRRFLRGWIAILSFEVDGLTKIPLNWLPQSIQAIGYTLVLLIPFFFYRRQSPRKTEKQRDADSVAVILSIACIVFLAASNFFHGNRVGTRVSLEVVPFLFFLFQHLVREYLLLARPNFQNRIESIRGYWQVRRDSQILSQADHH